MVRGVFLLCAGLAACCPAQAQLQFTDVTAASGIDYQQFVVAPPGLSPRFTGGLAVADVDGDGDLDVFATRIDAHDLLWLNQGDGTFLDGSAAAGLTAFDVYSNGAGFGDVDNDGDPDLYVTTYGAGGGPPNDRNYLFINDGNGFFVEEGAERRGEIHSPLPRTCSSVAFGDYDRDGYLDLHTTDWNPTGGSRGRLLRNKGDLGAGEFEEATFSAGVQADSIFGYASSFTDLDDDGWPDLVLTADFNTSKLFWNNGNGTFTDGTAAAGIGTEQNGMGATIGDIDGDGDLDLFVSAIYLEDDEGALLKDGNRLFRNDGGRLFSDRTDSAGVRDSGWGWGTAMFDADNDGDLDLVATNGYDNGSGSGDWIDDPMRLWRNDGGMQLTETAAAIGLTDTGNGRGLVVFDYDGDGLQDLLLVHNGGFPILYRNTSGGAHGWLRVTAIGSDSNRDGIGASVVVRPGGGASELRREIGSVTHYLGHSDIAAHFGLGASAGDSVERVAVRWPSGKVQHFADVATDRTFVVEESDCVDSDNDNRCRSADCDDAAPSVYVEAHEINDGIDNQCPGDPGYGLIDEVAGVMPSVDELRWTAQPGATLYEIVRAASPDMQGCSIEQSASPAVTIDPVAPGAIEAYLVRAVSPNAGSWGADGDGTPRQLACSVF